MRVTLWKNQKQTPEDPDFVVKQKQRTNADDGSPAYITATVGTGYKMLAPNGEVYLDVSINGFNNNQPKL